MHYFQEGLEVVHLLLGVSCFHVHYLFSNWITFVESIGCKLYVIEWEDIEVHLVLELLLVR